MFGYIKIYQPELKMREWEQYRGVYCTLCKRLGKRYGFLARFTLNYDFTFLAMFLMALQPACPTFQNSRCTYLPTRRCLKCQDTDLVDAAADIAMLMLYHKCRDDINDSGFGHKCVCIAALPLLNRAYKKAATANPLAAEAMKRYMSAQSAVEESRSPSVDEAAEPTASLMAYLCSAYGKDDATCRILNRFGYCLGRWIYLIDAIDDMPKDSVRGNYNPYLIEHPIRKDDAAAIYEARVRAMPSLNASLAECISAYELLTVYHFDGILRNILQEGMPHVQRAILGYVP